MSENVAGSERRLEVGLVADLPPTADTPAGWAAQYFLDRLGNAGVAAERVAPNGAVTGAFRVIVTAVADRSDAAAETAESFSVTRPNGSDGPIVVSAGGERGLVYALAELADRVEYSADPLGALREVEPTTQRPQAPLRSILRAFACEVEDKPWFYDRGFWTEYLTELATHRINRFHLALGMQYNYPHNKVTDNYFCFPYPYLFRVPGYDVRVGEILDEERDRNLEMLRFISDETARRGMRFQLGLWNHAYDQGETSTPAHPITGLSPDTHAEYCATALVQLLRACPAIGGLTLRVHVEGGIPEPGHDTFWRPVMNAVAGVGRPIELDLHAKGVDQDLLDIACQTGMPVVLGAKYWAEHQGLPYHQTTIRDKEKAATAKAGTGGPGAISSYLRRFTRYGYGDFLKENRDYDLLFRIWPGTQKVLLWGDPVLAAGYGRLGTIGGAIGVELCEPLTFKGRKGTGRQGGRDPYVDPALRLDGAEWRKYRYTYRLWGRLLYDPDADPESWRRFLRSEFGDAAPAVESALAPASRVLPLVTVVHGLSGSNSRYWPESYLNMPIAGGPNADHYARDTASPPTFGGVSSFDPSLFYRIDECADDLLAGRRDGRYPPEQVADWLEGLADEADEHLRASRKLVADPDDPQYRRVAVDVGVQAGLGRFFAGKSRAGLAYALFERTKDRRFLGDAVTAYRRARDAFAGVAELTSGVYQDDLMFGDAASEHGSWAQRLPDIDADLAEFERLLTEVDSSTEVSESVTIPDVPRAARPGLEHTAPSTYSPAEDLTIEIMLSGDSGIEVDLHYRHLNQGEDYQTLRMTADGSRYRGTIPGAYTTAPYPIAYYFVVHHPSGDAWIVPGLDSDLADQPYHVVRSPRGKKM